MSLFDWFRRKPEQKGMSTLDLFREIYGGRASSAGVDVNWSRALEVSTVLACVRVIANGVSQVPFRVMQETGNDRRVATELPLNLLLSRRPNPRQTSFAFRETLMFHMLLTGNAYVWKGMVGRDREIRRLDPLDPSRMTVRMRKNETIEYTYRGEDGTTVQFEEGEIWHLRGPSWNSWMGMDAVKLGRDAIGLSIATEQAHAERHKNGAQTSGVYSVEGELNSVERFELLAAWMDRHAVGGDRAHKPMILDGNAKFTPTQMTGVDAQHLETRKHQIEEICREFGVMPIMVGHADKTATYASAEQMFLAHVVHTLSPHYERVEQSADVNLLSEEQLAAGFYTKFSPNGLMRGAASDRATFYTQALGAGGHGTAWMTKNEVRALEDLPAISGGDEISEPTQDATAPADAEV
jgi:HK97 family phage portal protein